MKDHSELYRRIPKDDIISKRPMDSKRKFLSLLAVLALAVMAVSLALPARESPQAQAYYYTPTPDADGRILYVIKEGDTCISISLLNYVELDQLRILNNLNADCVLIPGNKLLLGTAAEAPTQSGPTATPTPLLPSPTPFKGTGKVCVVLFNDLNGNALAEEGEMPISDGAISLTDRLGKISLIGKTGTSLEEPSCFADLPEGDYNISVAAPEGYNPTTRTDYTLSLMAGDTSTLDFGAQVSSNAQPTPIGEGGRSPLLGLLGGLVILAGIGLGIYARFVSRR